MTFLIYTPLLVKITRQYKSLSSAYIHTAPSSSGGKAPLPLNFHPSIYDLLIAIMGHFELVFDTYITKLIFVLIKVWSACLDVLHSSEWYLSVVYEVVGIRHYIVNGRCGVATIYTHSVLCYIYIPSYHIMHCIVPLQITPIWYLESRPAFLENYC